MRCFICIDLPREIINEAERIQHELKKKNIFIGKFVEGENLHLTLKFLGEINEEKVEEVKRRLKEIKFKSFMAYLGELGVFSSNFIRIVWMHILGKKVEELQGLIDESMKEIGFDKESQSKSRYSSRQHGRFMSHLTIARVKAVKDKRLFLEELNKIKTQNLGWKVNEFYLMKSELKPEGAVYDILGGFKLEPAKI